MIHVVDYGVCNIGSILNMCRRIGVEAAVAASAADIERAERLILPGIGSFDAGVRNLAERDLIDALHRAVRERKVPTLGICLGMQLMAGASSEGALPGLGWIDAKVRHFTEIASSGQGGIKVPHIGWNFVQATRGHPVLEALEAPARFYFVHSYCVDTRAGDTLAVARYAGVPFTAMLARENIVGAQFHPEKSHRFGMRLIGNFAGWSPAA